MKEEQKKRLFRYAAIPLSLLLCGGIYFGALAISNVQFDSAVGAVGETEIEIRQGLWNYNALTVREQILYRALYDAMGDRKKETERVAIVPTEEEFTAAFDAVLCDYPLFCDLIREECTLNAAPYSASVTLAYLPDGGARRQAAADAVQAMVQPLSALSETEIAHVLHSSLAARCTWDTDDTGNSGQIGSTAYDALFLCETDGMGYALAYALLCRTAGIECAVVTGAVQSGDMTGAHAWNVLTLDGVTGYTDVMWDDAAASIPMDGAAEQTLPFHGYYFLSFEEMSADHTPTYGDHFWPGGETQNFYEQTGCCMNEESQLLPMLTSLLTDAQQGLSGSVEFWLNPQLNITDYALEEALTAAITAANDSALTGTPLLRQINRVYHASHDGGGITVQLFYEETEPLGETQ